MNRKSKFDVGSQSSDAARPTHAIVLSGPELISLKDSQWDSLCRYDEIVFARTIPEQKLRIVKEFRARDEIVGSEYL